MSTDLTILELVEGLVSVAGSDAQFMRNMAASGGPLQHLTLRNWRKGSLPNRPAHVLAISILSGRSAEDILRMILAPKAQKSA